MQTFNAQNSKGTIPVAGLTQVLWRFYNPVLPTTLRGQSRTYNTKNQLTGGSGVGTFGYDGAGNPTTYNGGSATFDVNDRMTALSGVLTAGYTAEGLRAWKQTAGGGRRYFLYDGGVPVVEMDTSGNVVAANTFGANGLVSRRNGSVSSFYTFDERSGLSVKTNGSGAVLGTATTDAFGTPTGVGALTEPYDGMGGQFGYYREADAGGLILCTNRWYDPNTARWLTRDPIGYEGGINLYGYCGNEPVGGADPSGLADLVGDARFF